MKVYVLETREYSDISNEYGECEWHYEFFDVLTEIEFNNMLESMGYTIAKPNIVRNRAGFEEFRFTTKYLQGE